MMMYMSSNEFGLYFVESNSVVLSDDDRQAYDFRPVHFPELAEYAERENVSGMILLEMKKCQEVYYKGVVPN